MPDEPTVEKLKINQSALPSVIYQRYRRLFKVKKDWAVINEKARDSFGQKGRDPQDLARAFDKLFSSQGGVWKINMMIARLHNQWDQVVGPLNASHSRVASYSDGLLVVAADSPVWANQLTYLAPQIRKKVRKKLPGLPVDEVKITGPQARRSRYSHRIR